MENLKFIIVGHIDHGKSTLIGRLLFDTNCLPLEKIAEIKKASKEMGREIEFSFFMDYLHEERAQGITIDTAQTFFKTNRREYVIIDAPGHVEFVKNMITGASQAEAGVVIIDAKEGVQEQTKRHSYILCMLGLGQIIVLINKMDLINYDREIFESITYEINHFLTSLHIWPKCYIPISALKGDNVVRKSEYMKWYRGPTFLDALNNFKIKISSKEKPLIMPVQDIYKIDGKQIIVGRVEAGSIGVGDEIKIIPDGQIITVKTIEKFLEKGKKVAKAGESIGVTTSKPVFIDRGYVICKQGNEPKLTDTISTNAFWLLKNDFNNHQRLKIRIATQEVSCKNVRILSRMNSSNLELIEKNADTLKCLEVGEVIIKTKKPIFIASFNDIPELGRYVLMRGRNVCATGIITKIEG